MYSPYGLLLQQLEHPPPKPDLVRMLLYVCRMVDQGALSKQDAYDEMRRIVEYWKKYWRST